MIFLRIEEKVVCVADTIVVVVVVADNCFVTGVNDRFAESLINLKTGDVYIYIDTFFAQKRKISVSNLPIFYYTFIIIESAL